MPHTPAYSITGNPNRALLGATLGFFVGFAAVALFGPTVSRFQEVMQLSPLMVGFLVAVPALSGSLLRIPFSAWADATGGRKPFLVLLWLSAGGMLGLFGVVALFYPDRLHAGFYPVLLLLGVLCGCGIATFSVGITQVSYWFPQTRQGWALGTYGGLGNLAPGMLSFLLPLAMGWLGLAGSYLAWLLFLVAGTTLYYSTASNARCFQLMAQGIPLPRAKQISRSHGQELFPTGGVSQSLGISARTWKTWVLVFVYFTSFGGFIALTAWLPTYWRNLFAVGAVAAGTLTALYSLLASAVRVAGGVVADRLGGERTAALALLVVLAGAVLMTAAADIGAAVVAEILLAVGMGATNAAVFKLVPQDVPEAVGGAAGWVGGLGAFGGFAIPPVLAAFVRARGTSGYSTGFVVFVGLALLSLGLTWVLGRARRARPAAAAVAAPAADRAPSRPLPAIAGRGQRR